MITAITGHTSGIGLALAEYFAKSSMVLGFSRSTGYDISQKSSRAQIVQECKHADIFVNNAFNNYDNSQTLMLQEMHQAWSHKHDCLIINISSRWTQPDNSYSNNKREQDEFCESVALGKPRVVNIKPGLVDTPRVTQVPGNRLAAARVVEIVDFIITTRYKYGITSITFGL